MKRFSSASVTRQEFYISDGLYQFGPFDRTELMDLISECQVSISDYIFDCQKKQWGKVAAYIAEFSQNKEKSSLASPSIVLGLDPNAISVENNFANTLNSGFEGSEKISPQVKKTVQRWWIKEERFVLGPYHYLSLLSLWKQGGLDPDYVILADGETEGLKASDFFAQDRLDFSNFKIKKIESQFSPTVSRRQKTRIVSQQLILIYSDTNCKIVQLYDLSPVALAFVSVDDYFFRGDELVCTLVDKHQKQHQFDGKVTSISKIDTPDGKFFFKKYVLQFDEEITAHIFDLFTDDSE